MSNFKLSGRSLERLVGVDMFLSSVMKTAIDMTEIDFGVGEGVRSKERQISLVAAGKSQTLNSKHLEGKAVDLLAYKGSWLSWEHEDFDKIADAIRQAAIQHEVPVRWGGAWTVSDIRQWEGPMHDARMSYIDTRKAENRVPFVDSPHFEVA
jgi:hypothetical protein|tara:strand:+ start:7470 stop:7925 length:456 start_codon:yes stop_codon:yes gene_type:complete